MPFVLPSLPACSQPLAELHLRDVLRDFCEFTHILQETLEPMDAVAGQAEYPLDLPAGCDLCLIQQVWWQNRPLAIVRSVQPWGGMSGTPDAIAQGPDNACVLNRTPANDLQQAIRLRVSLKPARNANRIPDVLLRDYGYIIGQGAIYRLLQIPGPGGSPSAAITAGNAYLLARTDARIRAERGLGTSAITVQPRRFI